jgi:hypothetical protein
LLSWDGGGGVGSCNILGDPEFNLTYGLTVGQAISMYRTRNQVRAVWNWPDGLAGNFYII